MSQNGGENNPHFRPRPRPGSDLTIPQHIQPEPMQPWDYHPTQIPLPDRAHSSRPRPRPNPVSMPEHDHQQPPPPMVPVRAPENVYPQRPTPPRRNRPTQQSWPVDILPVDQPNRHSRPVEGPPGSQPTQHFGPLGTPTPPIHQDKPKPARESRPQHDPRRQPTQHFGPVGGGVVHQDRPKPARQSRPHHGTSEHGPRRENLMYPEQGKTKPITWCGAVFCVILWLVVILGGLLVLVVYLVYRPRTPHFEISSASLNAVYLDMGYLLNADLTVLANFTNPNKRVHVDFSYVSLQLYFDNHLIANQYVEPFSASKAENKLANVEIVSSQVRLPIAVTQKLVTQIQRNRIMFEVNGIFHARSKFGSLLRYSYWLYGHCNIEMTGPPSGIVISSKCYTKD
ncbi:hypothetical protein RND81_11G011600 [Saponaria officinalis]|uniref:Late embryogenesis abundant protein LEA-2 subgroup domain-containing protein n=1 Tax=Saponaria officinalis TaxID=3572 RepID=A0AAW1HG29_SAPOF